MFILTKGLLIWFIPTKCLFDWVYTHKKKLVWFGLYPQKCSFDLVYTHRKRTDPLAIYITPRRVRKSGRNQVHQRDIKGMPNEPRGEARRTPGRIWVGRCKDAAEKQLNHAYHAKATKTKKHRRDTNETPDEPQGILSHTYHAKIEESRDRRDGGGTPRRASELCRNTHYPTPGSQKRRSKSGEHRKDGGGMLRYISDPLVVHIVPHLSSGK